MTSKKRWHKLYEGDNPFELPRAIADEIRECAKAYREVDDRVDIIDHKVDDHGMLKLHNFYVRYLLPLMVEVQFFEYEPRGGQGD